MLPEEARIRVTHQLYPGSDALPTHPHREGLFPVNSVVAQVMIVAFATMTHFKIYWSDSRKAGNERL